MPARLSLVAADERIRLVKRAFEAFGSRDLDTLVELSDPEIEISSVTGIIAGREEPYTGSALSRTTSATSSGSGTRSSSCPRSSTRWRMATAFSSSAGCAPVAASLGSTRRTPGSGSFAARRSSACGSSRAQQGREVALQVGPVPATVPSVPGGQNGHSSKAEQRPASSKRITQRSR